MEYDRSRGRPRAGGPEATALGATMSARAAGGYIFDLGRIRRRLIASITPWKAPAATCAASSGPAKRPTPSRAVRRCPRWRGGCTSNGRSVSPRVFFDGAGYTTRSRSSVPFLFPSTPDEGSLWQPRAPGGGKTYKSRFCRTWDGLDAAVRWALTGRIQSAGQVARRFGGGLWGPIPRVHVEGSGLRRTSAYCPSGPA